MKKENIILLILSSIYALIIEYMFYPEYTRYQEAGELFLATNDYLSGYLLAPAGWNSLLTNFFRPSSTTRSHWDFSWKQVCF